MLNNTKIKNLKPKDKAYSISDGYGLYVEVKPNGSKYWRQNYRYNGKQKKLAHGVFPKVSLLEAREKRDKALKQLKEGNDPSKLKQLDKSLNQNTFEIIAKEWFEKESINWKASHAAKVWRQVDADILPFLGDERIDKISATDLLSVLKKVEKRGALDVVSRLRQRCEAIFRLAILTDRASFNPATQLVGVLKTKRVEHRKALSEKELPDFLKQHEIVSCDETIRLAFKILIHTFVRTTELRLASWDEIDLKSRQWVIPAERMKMGKEHIVPLTDQTIELFDQVKQLNGNQPYIFASPQRRKQPLSNNVFLQVIFRMGYRGKATGHGFRATASTILNESGFNPDAIERQLAHTESNKVRAAYNRSEYLKERIEMMNWWSEYLERGKHNA